MPAVSFNRFCAVLRTNFSPIIQINICQDEENIQQFLFFIEISYYKATFTIGLRSQGPQTYVILAKLKY